MATQESNDSNILDAETINWRLIIYPIVAATLLVVGGFSYYYYLQDQRMQVESQAREALLKAQSPEEMVKVADQFPGTDQATLALLEAAGESYNKKDYDAAAKYYQRIIDAKDMDPQMRNSAQLGLASTLDASGKVDEAIRAYLDVARLGTKTFYAPFAYDAVVRIYAMRGDKDNERKILAEMSSLASDSEFVKQAQLLLQELNAAPAAAMPESGAPPVAAPPTTGAPAPVKP